MPSSPPPDPHLRIFDATMRAVLGPATLFTPSPDPEEVGIPLPPPASAGIKPSPASEEDEESTVELPRLDYSVQPAEPALFLLSPGRHRMW